MKRRTEKLLTKHRNPIYIEDQIEGIYLLNDKNEVVGAINDYGRYNSSEEEGWYQLSEMHNVKNIEDQIEGIYLVNDKNEVVGAINDYGSK